MSAFKSFIQKVKKIRVIVFKIGTPCLGTIGLIAASWKFGVLKSSMLALEASFIKLIYQ